MKIKNKYKIWRNRLFIIFMILGLLLIFLPKIANINGFDGGFAIISIGVLFIIISLITYMILQKYSKMYKQIANFENILAKWTVPQELFKEFIEYDKSKEISRYKMMFLIISFVSLIVGIILIIMGLEFKIIAVIILALIIFIWIVSRIAIFITKRKNSSHNADIIIAIEGGIINDNLHNWSKLGSYIVKCKIVRVSSVLNVLEIVYSTLQRTGEVYYTARFPFPTDMNTEINRIKKELMLSQKINT